MQTNLIGDLRGAPSFFFANHFRLPKDQTFNFYLLLVFGLNLGLHPTIVCLACLHTHLQLLFLHPSILVEFADKKVSQILGEAIEGGLILGKFFVSLLLDVLQDVEDIRINIFV